MEYVHMKLTMFYSWQYGHISHKYIGFRVRGIVALYKVFEKQKPLPITSGEALNVTFFSFNSFIGEHLRCEDNSGGRYFYIISKEP